jgi:Uma2 family endonuclease
MALPVEKRGNKFTYRDYLSWPPDERWELIEGVAYDMTPAPSVSHQRILIELARQFASYLLDKPCEVLPAPLDVRLPREDEREEDIQTVVQPDLIVVCDPSKLDERGCRGGPDLVVEITSLTTARKDMKDKFYLYERAGVKEYWIVQPADRVVMVFKMDEKGRYGRPEIYSEEDNIEVGLFSGDLSVDLRAVFGG